MFIKPVTWATLVLAVVIGYTFYNSESFEESSLPQVLTKEQYKDYKRQLLCLADNIYYEAGNQSIKGKRAVAYVTLNRANSNYWPSDICDVVYQKTKNATTGITVCQFSWVCEKHRRRENDIWTLSYNIAKHVMKEYYSNNSDPTNGSNYYHANYVSPGWKLQKVVQIESHIFYK